MTSSVLVVDDNGDDRWSLGQILKLLMHHEVTEATDGLEAIRLAEADGFDLILIDLNMPKLQGWEVVKTLRQMKGYATTPIIAVTAYDMPEARRASLQSGCNRYVTKPVDVDQLVQLISEYFDPAA